MRTPAALELDGLCLGYGRHTAVCHLSGRFAPGSKTAIVGPNGSGKSTLLKGLTGSLAPLHGRVNRHGLGPREVAYLPQQSGIDRSFPISVIDTVCLGHWHRVGLFRPVTRHLRAQAEAALATVGLEGFGDRRVSALSVGQFQRVLFARIIVQDCPLIILDEPFSAMDATTSADLLQVIDGWHREGRTIIAVLHDLAQVREHFPETLLMAGEQIAWGPTEDALRDEPLQRARLMAERRARSPALTLVQG